MIKCPKCGADNMMNAIFCRSCGDKLDLASLKIEEQLGLEEKKAGNSKAMNKAKQIGGAVGVLVVLIILGMMILPIGGFSIEKGDLAGDLVKKITLMNNPSKDQVVECTDLELSTILTKKFGFPWPNNESFIEPYGVAVHGLSSGRVEIVWQCDLFGFLPWYVSYTAQPTVGKKGDVKLEDISGASIGILPLPGFFTEEIVNRCNSRATSNDLITNGKKNITKIDVSEGKIAFSVEKKPLPKKKKPAAPAAKPVAAPTGDIELPF